jgi:hypothetical protein
MDMLVAQRTRLVLAVKLADVFDPKEFRKSVLSLSSKSVWTLTTRSAATGAHGGEPPKPPKGLGPAPGAKVAHYYRV